MTITRTYTLDDVVELLEEVFGRLDRIEALLSNNAPARAARAAPARGSKVKRQDYQDIITWLAHRLRHGRYYSPGAIYKDLDPGVHFGAKYVYGKCMALVRENVCDMEKNGETGRAVFRLNPSWAAQNIHEMWEQIDDE